MSGMEGAIAALDKWGMQSDDELYAQYLAGDVSACDALMLRYGDALVIYLNGLLHHPQDAEDLMLDCFARIMVDRPRIGAGNFRAYLFKMARYKANRLFRTKVRRGEFSLEELPFPADEDPPEAELHRRERSEALQRCLNRIAPQYREALWLIYDTQLTYAQAAVVLHCDVKRIDNLLFNGKKQLRLELEREGVTYADI
jgi:RNA polymerase sigma-70 factor (ECF subfamily)